MHIQSIVSSMNTIGSSFFVQFEISTVSRSWVGVPGQNISRMWPSVSGETSVDREEMSAASWTLTGTGSPSGRTWTSPSTTWLSARSGSLIRTCSSPPSRVTSPLSVAGEILNFVIYVLCGLLNLCSFRKYLVGLAQTLYFLGVVIGVLLFGILADVYGR